MTETAAFKATYSDWKLIRTRGVVQVVMEVPLAEADAAYGVLGGMPNPANETWFGIAPINLHKPAKENKTSVAPTPRQDPKSVGGKWRDLQPAAQAGIRCAEPTFRVFLCEMHGYDASSDELAAKAVRDFCGVNSRVELAANHKARVLWHQLDEQFQAWKALEHA